MKIKNFFKDKGEIPSWILTAKEERNLAENEREAYLDKLYAYCKERKLEVTTDGATTLGPKLKGITNKLTAAVTKLMAGAPVERIVTGWKIFRKVRCYLQVLIKVFLTIWHGFRSVRNMP